MSEENLWGLRPQPDDTSAFEIASRQVRRCDRVLLWAYVIFGVVVMALGLFAILTQ